MTFSIKTDGKKILNQNIILYLIVLGVWIFWYDFIVAPLSKLYLTANKIDRSILR